MLSRGMTSTPLALVTTTYRGDLQRFAILRDSIRRYGTRFPHIAIVQTEDYGIFSERYGGDIDITLLRTADVLPKSVESQRRAARTGRGLRSLLSRRAPVGAQEMRGWYAQQLSKLFFLRETTYPTVAFIDSDLFLCESIEYSDFFYGQEAKLFRRRAANAESLDFDISTYEILGRDIYYVKNSDLYDFIFHPVIFRASTGRRLFDHLERSMGRKWVDRFIAERRPSEYNLLGHVATDMEELQGYHIVDCAPEDVHYSIRTKSTAEKMQGSINEIYRVRKKFFLVQSTAAAGPDWAERAYAAVLERNRNGGGVCVEPR